MLNRNLTRKAAVKVYLLYAAITIVQTAIAIFIYFLLSLVGFRGSATVILIALLTLLSMLVSNLVLFLVASPATWVATLLVFIPLLVGGSERFEANMDNLNRRANFFMENLNWEIIMIVVLGPYLLVVIPLILLLQPFFGLEYNFYKRFGNLIFNPLSIINESNSK